MTTYNDLIKNLSTLASSANVIKNESDMLKDKKISLSAQIQENIFFYILENKLSKKDASQLYHQIEESLTKPVFARIRGNLNKGRDSALWILNGNTININDSEFSFKDFDSASQLPDNFSFTSAYNYVASEKKRIKEITTTNQNMQEEAVARGLKESPVNGVDSESAMAILGFTKYGELLQRGQELLNQEQQEEQEANDNLAFGVQLNEVIAFLQNNADKDDLNAFQQAIDIRRVELI